MLRPLCLEGPRGEQKTDCGSRFLQLVPGRSVVPGACQVEEATSVAPYRPSQVAEVLATEGLTARGTHRYPTSFTGRLILT